MVKRSLALAAALAMVLAAAPPVQADFIFSTPAGSEISGLPVSAKVTFTMAADQITVVLENLQADPKSVGQNLSSLLFTVSTGQSSGALTSSSAVPRWVANKGAYTDGPADTTGWELRTTGGQLDLYVLGVQDVDPSHTILGPPAASDKYQSAKGSIAGNAPHNPFLAEVATYVLEVPGVTAQSAITKVTFGFNTAPGDTITVPEPASAVVLALGALAALLKRRRKA